MAKENDGVNYLLVVIDVFSKFFWVKSMKNKTASNVVQAFDSILSEKRKPEKLRTDIRVLNLLTNRFSSILRSKESNFILQKRT